MSDERRSEGGGAIVVIVVVLIIFGLVGIVGVGGGMWAYHRMNLLRMEAEVQERQAMAQMMEAEMRAKEAALERLKVHQAAAEIHLQIDAAGNYKLAGQPVNSEDLVEALNKTKTDQPKELGLLIQAHKDVRFDQVEKVIKAAKEAGLSEQSVKIVPEP
jgi:biopolymer transport protein ExbD